MNLTDTIAQPTRRPLVSPAVLLWVYAVCALLVVGFAILWWQREPIANGFVARELAARDVRAQYKLVQVGLRTQRIENLVLGNPVTPDLTARSVEVDISYAGLRPHVSGVRARGVRIYGQVREGRLTLGELDKFRDPTSSRPFSLPDLDLTLDDARMRIDTPAGTMGAMLNGSGNLRSGFAGKLAAVIRNAHMTGCASPLVTGYLDVRIRSGKPHLAGPVRAQALGCPASGIALAKAVARLDVGLSEALDHWSGRAEVGADAMRLKSIAMGRPSADVHFDGSATQAQGRVAMAAGVLKYAAVQTGAIEASGAWRFAQSASGITASFQGQLGADDVRPLDSSSLHALRNAGAGTPVGPLVARLMDAAQAAGRDNKLRSFVRLAQTGATGRMTVNGLDFTSASGVHIALSKDGSFAYGWPTGQWAMVGSLTSAGGGFPGAALRLSPVAGGAGCGARQ